MKINDIPTTAKSHRFGVVSSVLRARVWKIIRGNEHLIVLGAVLILSFMLRFNTANYGLPYAYHWDEPEIMQPAIRVLRNETYIPAKFDYGSLNTYTHAAWGALSYIRGISTNEFPDSIWGLKSDADTGWYWSISSPYLWQQARYLSVLLGMVTIVFTYAAGVKLGSLWIGVWAAGIIGFLYTPMMQQSFVTADATSMAAVAVALWASVEVYQSGARWAYVTAAVACAAAGAFKYNTVVVAGLPLVAHFLYSKRSTRSVLNAQLVTFCGWFAFALTLLMIPAFLRPTKFLHDIYSALSYYSVPADSRILSRGSGYLLRGLALFDAGEFSGPAGRDSTQQYTFEWYGIGLACVTLYGMIVTARTTPGLFALLFSVVFLNFTNVGGDTGFFFTRYLLPSLPALAILGGLGWVHMCRGHLLSRRLGTVIIVAMAALLFIPVIGRTGKRAISNSRIQDPRLQLSNYIMTQLPEGSRICIFDETRWHSTAAETKRFSIKRATLSRAFTNPDVTFNSEYIIRPLTLDLNAPHPIISPEVAELNRRLAGTKPIVSFGDRPMYFGKPSVVPAVGLFRNPFTEPGFQRVIPSETISAMTFDPGLNVSGVGLGDGTLSVRPGVAVISPVNLTKDMRSVALRAQGGAPYRGLTVPNVSFAISSTSETLFSAPLEKATFTLARSQSRIAEYRANVAVPAGNYWVSLQVSDPENHLVRIEALIFRP